MKAVASLEERIIEMQEMIQGQSHFQPYGLSYWGFDDLNRGVGSMTASYDSYRRRLPQILQPSGSAGFGGQDAALGPGEERPPVRVDDIPAVLMTSSEPGRTGLRS
jgi:hypothetical protein